MSGVSLGIIKAVTFDAGGTLIEPFPSVGHVYAAVAAEFGLSDMTPEELNSSFTTAWKKRHPFDYSMAHWQKLVEQTFEAPLPKGLFERIYERFEKGSAWRVYKDVQETLRELRDRGLKLAVISNWDDRLLNLLQSLGIAQYLDATVLSVQVGATKPAAAIFQRTLQLLNVDASQALHVGDSYSEDIVGAEACGMQGVLLDCTGQAPGSISSLRELLRL